MNVKTQKSPTNQRPSVVVANTKQSKKSSEQSHAMRSHAEHIRFQIENVQMAEEEFNSEEQNAYLSQLTQLISQVFLQEDEPQHDVLVEMLKRGQGFIQEFAKSYRTQQQLADL